MASSEVAIANQISLQPKRGTQTTKPIKIPGEPLPEQSKIAERLEIPRVEFLELEPSRQLNSDRLINRTLRLR